jgi:hypothetical protein
MLLLSGCIHRELIISGPKNDTPSSIKVEESSRRTTKPKIMATEDTTIIPRVSFPEEEYRGLAKSGNGTIKGSIFVSDAYGKKTYGKQTRLYLNPVTSYSKQWYQESYIGGYKMAKADKRLFNYLKFTASNAQGKFAFYGVPSGAYYVIGMVKCGKECGYDTPRNIRIAKEVSISGSGVVSVDLGKMID